MKILIAGFKGNDNSAKILLDNIKELSSAILNYIKTLSDVRNDARR